MNDIFVLKKNSWHLKLMKFIWGYSHRDFPNMCPYFWLSIFNVVLVIVGCIPYSLFFVFRIVFKSMISKIANAAESFDDYCQSRKTNWLNNFLDKLLSDDLTAFEEIEKDPKLERKLKWDTHNNILYYARYTEYTRKELSDLDEDTLNKIFILRENFKKWDALQAEKAHKRELFLAEQRNREQTLKEEAIARRKKISQITVKLKFLFKIVGVILIVGVIYLIGLLFHQLYLMLLKVDYVALFKALYKVGVIVSAAIVISGLCFGLYKSITFLWCRFGSYCIPCEMRRNKLKNFFKWLFLGNSVMNNTFNFFTYTGKGIKEIFEVIKMLYKNNCPPTEWVD